MLDREFYLNCLRERDQASGYAFSEPKGQDKIKFSTNSGYEYSVQFNVR